MSYVEHHRTLGDWVALLADAGFVITELVEPEWPEGHERVWGGWSGTRGRFTPGTAIFGAELRLSPASDPDGLALRSSTGAGRTLAAAADEEQRQADQQHREAHRVARPPGRCRGPA